MSFCNGEDLAAALVIRSFRILTLALELGRHRRKLVSLGPDGVRIRDILSVVDLFGQRVDLGLQGLQLSLSRLKFTIQGAQQTIEPGDTVFRIEKSVRIDHRHFAVRNGHGLRCGGRSCGRCGFLLG